MNLPFDLQFEIQRKIIWGKLQPHFNTPLQILSANFIKLATHWLFLEQFQIDEETVPTLAHFGHADTVKWLYSNGFHLKPHSKAVMYEVDWSDYPIDMAAANGYLDLVQWLFEKGEGFTTFAMDYAAMNDHLHVLEWVQSHGGACTTIAFDAAAGAGNLEILKWLVKNRRERWSRSIFKNNDELRPEIYKFIFETSPELFHPNLIVNAARCGDLETLKALYALNGGQWQNFRGESYMNRAYIEAGKRGHISVVIWFIEMKLLI